MGEHASDDALEHLCGLAVVEGTVGGVGQGALGEVAHEANCTSSVRW